METGRYRSHSKPTSDLIASACRSISELKRNLKETQVRLEQSLRRPLSQKKVSALDAHPSNTSLTLGYVEAPNSSTNTSLSASEKVSQRGNQSSIMKLERNQHRHRRKRPDSPGSSSQPRRTRVVRPEDIVWWRGTSNGSQANLQSPPTPSSPVPPPAPAISRAHSSATFRFVSLDNLTASSPVAVDAVDTPREPPLLTQDSLDRLRTIVERQRQRLYNSMVNGLGEQPPRLQTVPISPTSAQPTEPPKPLPPERKQGPAPYIDRRTLIGLPPETSSRPSTAPSPKKPKRITKTISHPKGLITTRCWRDAQKLINQKLGPVPPQPSPPHKSSESDLKRKSPVMDSAKGSFEPKEPNVKRTKRESKPALKKKLSEPDDDAAMAKQRNYDSQAVRQYMARKMKERKQSTKEAQRRKNEDKENMQKRLEQLYTYQRRTARKATAIKKPESDSEAKRNPVEVRSEHTIVEKRSLQEGHQKNLSLYVLEYEDSVTHSSFMNGWPEVRSSVSDEGSYIQQHSHISKMREEAKRMGPNQQAKDSNSNSAESSQDRQEEYCKKFATIKHFTKRAIQKCYVEENPVDVGPCAGDEPPQLLGGTGEANEEEEVSEAAEPFEDLQKLSTLWPIRGKQDIEKIRKEFNEELQTLIERNFSKLMAIQKDSCRSIKDSVPLAKVKHHLRPTSEAAIVPQHALQQEVYTCAVPSKLRKPYVKKPVVSFDKKLTPRKRGTPTPTKSQPSVVRRNVEANQVPRRYNYNHPMVQRQRQPEEEHSLMDGQDSSELQASPPETWEMVSDSSAVHQVEQRPELVVESTNPLLPDAGTYYYHQMSPDEDEMPTARTPSGFVSNRDSSFVAKVCQQIRQIIESSCQDLDLERQKLSSLAIICSSPREDVVVAQFPREVDYRETNRHNNHIYVEGVAKKPSIETVMVSEPRYQPRYASCPPKPSNTCGAQQQQAPCPNESTPISFSCRAPYPSGPTNYPVQMPTCGGQHGAAPEQHQSCGQDSTKQGVMTKEKMRLEGLTGANAQSSCKTEPSCDSPIYDSVAVEGCNGQQMQANPPCPTAQAPTSPCPKQSNPIHPLCVPPPFPPPPPHPCEHQVYPPGVPPCERPGMGPMIKFDCRIPYPSPPKNYPVFFPPPPCPEPAQAPKQPCPEPPKPTCPPQQQTPPPCPPPTTTAPPCPPPSSPPSQPCPPPPEPALPCPPPKPPCSSPEKSTCCVLKAEPSAEQLGLMPHLVEDERIFHLRALATSLQTQIKTQTSCFTRLFEEKQRAQEHTKKRKPRATTPAVTLQVEIAQQDVPHKEPAEDDVSTSYTDSFVSPTQSENTPVEKIGSTGTSPTFLHNFQEVSKPLNGPAPESLSQPASDQEAAPILSVQETPRPDSIPSPPALSAGTALQGPEIFVRDLGHNLTDPIGRASPRLSSPDPYNFINTWARKHQDSAAPSLPSTASSSSESVSEGPLSDESLEEQPLDDSEPSKEPLFQEPPHNKTASQPMVGMSPESLGKALQLDLVQLASVQDSVIHVTELQRLHGSLAAAREARDLAHIWKESEAKFRREKEELQKKWEDQLQHRMESDRRTLEQQAQAAADLAHSFLLQKQQEIQQQAVASQPTPQTPTSPQVPPSKVSIDLHLIPHPLPSPVPPPPPLVKMTTMPRYQDAQVMAALEDPQKMDAATSFRELLSKQTSPDPSASPSEEASTNRDVSSNFASLSLAQDYAGGDNVNNFPDLSPPLSSSHKEELEGSSPQPSSNSSSTIVEELDGGHLGSFPVHEARLEGPLKESNTNSEPILSRARTPAHSLAVIQQREEVSEVLPSASTIAEEILSKVFSAAGPQQGQLWSSLDISHYSRVEITTRHEDLATDDGSVRKESSTPARRSSQDEEYKYSSFSSSSSSSTTQAAADSKLSASIRKKSLHPHKGGQSKQEAATSLSLLQKASSSQDSTTDELASVLSEETRMAADMFHQMTRIEESRAHHQLALLRLQEQALMDKARAEMVWLEVIKKKLRQQGAEDRIPRIRKRQRALLLRFHQEKNNLKLLQQSCRGSLAEPPEGAVPSISLGESILEDIQSQASHKSSQGPQPDPAPSLESMSQSFKQLEASRKLLSHRETKLSQRRKDAEQMLRWQQNLKQQEKEVREMEQKVLEGTKALYKPEKSGNPQVPLEPSFGDHASIFTSGISSHLPQLSPPVPVYTEAFESSPPKLRSLLVPCRQRISSGSDESNTFVSGQETDASDVETRIQALSQELRERQRQAESLKRQQKKKYHKHLKEKEITLKKQIEAYDQYIEEAKQQLEEQIQHPSPGNRPQIKQPPFHHPYKSHSTPSPPQGDGRVDVKTDPGKEVSWTGATVPKEEFSSPELLPQRLSEEIVPHPPSFSLDPKTSKASVSSPEPEYSDFTPVSENALEDSGKVSSQNSISEAIIHSVDDESRVSEVLTQQQSQPAVHQSSDRDDEISEKISVISQPSISSEISSHLEQEAAESSSGKVSDPKKELASSSKQDRDLAQSNDGSSGVSQYSLPSDPSAPSEVGEQSEAVLTSGVEHANLPRIPPDDGLPQLAEVISERLLEDDSASKQKTDEVQSVEDILERIVAEGSGLSDVESSQPMTTLRSSSSASNAQTQVQTAEETMQAEIPKLADLKPQGEDSIPSELEELPQEHLPEGDLVSDVSDDFIVGGPGIVSDREAAAEIGDLSSSVSENIPEELSALKDDPSSQEIRRITLEEFPQAIDRMMYRPSVDLGLPQETEESETRPTLMEETEGYTNDKFTSVSGNSPKSHESSLYQFDDILENQSPSLSDKESEESIEEEKRLEQLPQTDYPDHLMLALSEAEQKAVVRKTSEGDSTKKEGNLKEENSQLNSLSDVEEIPSLQEEEVPSETKAVEVAGEEGSSPQDQSSSQLNELELRYEETISSMSAEIKDGSKAVARQVDAMAEELLSGLLHDAIASMRVIQKQRHLRVVTRLSDSLSRALLEDAVGCALKALRAKQAQASGRSDVTQRIHSILSVIKEDKKSQLRPQDVLRISTEPDDFVAAQSLLDYQGSAAEFFNEPFEALSVEVSKPEEEWFDDDFGLGPPPPYRPPALPPPPVVPVTEPEVGEALGQQAASIHQACLAGSLAELTFSTNAGPGDTLESRSQSHFQHFLHDLAKETALSLYRQDNKHKLAPQPPMPQDTEQFASAVCQKAMKELQVPDTLPRGRRKRDRVDLVLAQELRAEDRDWVVTDDTPVLIQLADQVLEYLVGDLVGWFAARQ